jgi:hypothetical protein
MTRRYQDDEGGAFQERARRAFDDSVQALDAATLSRLNRARQTALEGAGRREGLRADWRVLAGVAAAAVLALGLWLNGDPGDPSAAGEPSVVVAMAPEDTGDLEIVLQGDSLDMLAELEFYDWVDSVEGFHGSAAGPNIG